MKDVSFILKNTGMVGIGQGFHIFFRYVYTFLATRLLGPVTYGLFVLGRAVVQFTSVLSEFGLGMAIQRHIAYYSGKKNTAKINQFISLGIFIAILNSLILAGMIFFASDLLATKVFRNNELSLILKLLSFSIPIITLLRIFYNIFQGFKEIKYRLALEYLIVHITNISLLVFLVILGFKIKGIIWAFIIANFITLLGAVLFYRKLNISPLKKSVKIEKETRKELVKFAAPLVFSNTLNFLQRWTDTFLLGILSTSFAVGIYNVSFRLGAFVAMPLMAFNMIFSPLIAEIFAKKDLVRLKTNYQLVTKMVFSLSLMIYSIILLFPAELLSVFGKEFKDAAIVLVLISLGQLINASVGATGRMLVMTGHPKIEFYNSIVFLILTLVLNLILIPKYNVLGAGIANMITLSVINLARVFQIYKVIRIHPFRWDYLKPVVAFFISVSIIFVIKKIIVINFFTFGLLVSLLVLIYGLVILGMGLKEEEKWILQQVKEKILAMRHGKRKPK